MPTKNPKTIPRIVVMIILGPSFTLLENPLGIKKQIFQVNFCRVGSNFSIPVGPDGIV